MLKGLKNTKSLNLYKKTQAKEMHVVVKPWPFRGWAMGVIDEVYMALSKRHIFILVSTNYFTKWVEAKPLVTATQEVVFRFIKHNIILLLRIPESITTDQGIMITGDKVNLFVQQFDIKLVHSTPYYKQANEKVEATNKILIDIIKKNL